MLIVNYSGFSWASKNVLTIMQGKQLGFMSFPHPIGFEGRNLPLLYCKQRSSMPVNLQF